MKRSIIFCLISMFLLAGCTKSDDQIDISWKSDGSVETEKAKRYEFDFTEDNYWYFLDVSVGTASAGSYSSITCEFKGVLSYAYYENVVFTIDYAVRGTGGNNYNSTTGEYHADVLYKLNAAGNGSIIFSYETIPENIIPSFPTKTTYNYNRSCEIKSVAGRVLFSI